MQTYPEVSMCRLYSDRRPSDTLFRPKTGHFIRACTLILLCRVYFCMARNAIRYTTNGMHNSGWVETENDKQRELNSTSLCFSLAHCVNMCVCTEEKWGLYCISSHHHAMQTPQLSQLHNYRQMSNR